MGMSDKLFGNYTIQNKNRIKRIVERIDSSSIKDKYSSMSDEELKEMTAKFKEEIKNGKTLDDILVDALAVCREVTKRQLGMFHYNVQLEAAVAMHDNAIAEMKTGEGKTLVQILSAYLNALEGKGVHVITSNDYLAGRDMEQNIKVFEALGLSCGNVLPKSKMSTRERRAVYDCDIVYGTASTIAFDYLSDNRVMNPNDRVNRRGFNYAIIDEVDSILLDDGITPLISAETLKPEEGEPADKYTSIYKWACDFVEDNGITCQGYDKESYYDSHKEEMIANEKASNAKIADAVVFHDSVNAIIRPKLESKIIKNLWPGKKWEDLTAEEQGEYHLRVEAVRCYLLAKFHYKSGTHYSVRPSKSGEKDKDGLPKYNVEIIGENTGRILQGRRFMNGIHECLEAKEARIARTEGRKYSVDIKEPTVTTAMCTYPDFFSLYKSGICGMTGTSNEQDFMDIYGLPTYSVPSRKTNIRRDMPDEVYATKNAKYKAIIEEVIKCQETLQPVLIGVTSVEESMLVSKLLAEQGIRHSVLNAEQDANENGIIQNAGQLGRVTIATNMAGRGTDIKLGEGVREVGGLYVIGTTRNRSERVDNQLKGRAGRQGDPGQTKFYASLEDEFVRKRAGESLIKCMSKYYNKAKITVKKVINLVVGCQKSQEAEDKKSRIIGEKYNSVLTTQKNGVYEYRNLILDSKSVMPLLEDSVDRFIDDLFERSTEEEIQVKIGHLVDLEKYRDIRKKKEMKSAICADIKHKLHTIKVTPEYEKSMKTKMLKILDDYWISQMGYLEDMKKGSGLSVYAEKDPYEEYKMNATMQFADMISYVRNEMLTYALNPSLKYGEYHVPEIDYSESEMIRL
ncbi:MAG: DEAD/DEAH box helicase [Bacilli bacterium]